MFSNLMLTADGSSYTYLFGQLGVMIVMIAVLWFFLIRPQNKREKEVSKMREALEVGDEVITRGGIIGRVVNLKDDLCNDRNRQRPYQDADRPLGYRHQHHR